MTKRTEKVPSHVIAIGASAGGLEALQSLFQELPTDLGVAYVVIQHLSPDFKSVMDELLGKVTRMPIHQATEGDTLLADNVYLIPPAKVMRIAESTIYLSDIVPDARVNLLINEFFRSLAEDFQNRAVGIILSGTGSDGSRGVLSLKEMGAMVLAQNPAEAQFDGMPMSAINTGCVDFVLDVKKMPQRIEQFINHPIYQVSIDQPEAKITDNVQIVSRILDIIQFKTDMDFSGYKESTVSRRIEHRMTINNRSNLQQYLNYLLSEPDEVDLLKQDLLIGVTQFFRDAEVWDGVITKVIEPIIEKSKPSETVRVWCAGCSTGEEAYTLGILFSEAMHNLNITRNVKIFASDIDQVAINFAASGTYPTSIASEMPTKYLSSYFNLLTDNSYQVNKQLRSMVVFATHNLIQDPPFSNMDLITCRNTLIYLQSPSQQKALSFFHFALKVEGHLLLGTAESLGGLTHYFDTVEPKLRIYKKTRDIKVNVGSLPAKTSHRAVYQPKSIPNFIARSHERMAEFARTPNLIGKEELFAEFIPPTFVMNQKLQVVHMYGNIEQFTIKPKTGEVTNDVSDIVIPELVSHALSACHQAIRQNVSIKLQDVYRSDGKSWSIKCAVLQSASHAGEKFVAFSLLCSDATFEQADVVYSFDEQAKQRIDELDESLIECQKLYREVLQDLDTTKEELQSSNEELMAANEELQSTNEELQSVNEELYTVNSEYQIKISELTDANNDFESLLKTTQMAVLFLNRDLQIRKFTHAVKRFVNILEFDLNRDFRDITFKFNVAGFYELVEAINQGAAPQLCVYDFDGTKVEISISPYVNGKENLGVIVSMRELLEC
ncbi:Chemotaxis protein methyltransferase CheR [Pseudoalteromonas luteoviolacea B = ATCC 29581]|nr:Chemotaxis protein methyltransferase CheR [Pseudoalteromonas luteoviolacea B = ATCC 29581]